ncbi:MULTISPECIES: hypothetical protein [unclassified Brevundimonas]|uniref:hypothetical protein n=1 Tax=unclassified Brevundimonas TaxID=2622653 RepID=UPI0025C5EC09|nr:MULTISPECIES: hypothetical protein [unclassified Brevundimonas]
MAFSFARTAKAQMDRAAQSPYAAAPTLRPFERKSFADRYLIVPCETEADLAVIWDRQEEQVVDVICAPMGHYSEEDAMWDEFRSAAALAA